jgi:geranylgeranyl pyrophosphate synthase
LIALGAAMAAGGKAGDAAYPAAAIELLHNYTLVHDDLPSMDNDEMRRGNPTVWKKFGEVNAILAGDALQALAFSAAAKTPNNAAKVVAALADAGVGVVAGQVEDIAATGDTAYIYEHKTADLFVSAAAMGALAASADGVSLSKLKSFALNLGLAFQYQDDLIDGDSPYSREETERLAAETTDRALAALENLPGDASVLKELASRLLGRSV